MWSGKMAAQWMGNHGKINTANNDLMANSSPSELVLTRHHVEGLEVDMQSCVDQSIRAIFEDCTEATEDRGGVEEESQKLLSALTEMLDNVGDDDGVLSPFDSLPDTKLLTCENPSDVSEELSLVDRLRPRSKPLNEAFAVRIDGGKEDESKREKISSPHLLRQKQQVLFNSKNKKAEPEVEVFTSASLANLVKIMHPYCLRLHVEEEVDKSRSNHTLFSQEEVWKYERPPEEIDEEINVVSDEEVTVEKGKERDERTDHLKPLKSVLLNGNSPRKKKRVSFGPVQVASFNESLETGLENTGGNVSGPVDTSNSPAGSAQEPQTLSSEINRNKAEVLPPKAQMKTKSLSLQQYRQLRQKRRPPVEKQGNYCTKWPSVSEPPKELTPILCLQGHNSCGPKPPHHDTDDRTHAIHLSAGSPMPHPPPPEPRPSTPPHPSGLKRPRAESRITSPASLRPRRVKKPLVSSDPPNPVLLSLPVSQTSMSTDPSSSDSNLDSSGQIQNKSSGTSFQQQTSSSGPKPDVLSENQNCTPLHHGMKTRVTATVSGTNSLALCPSTKRIKPSSDHKDIQPQKSSLNLTKESKLEPKTPQSTTNEGAPIAEMKPLAEVPNSKSTTLEPPLTLQLACSPQSAADLSGIEAHDLTSLLEQFEETQSKADKVEPPVELVKNVGTSESPGENIRNLPHVQMPDSVDVPQPLENEVILSTQPDLPARRKNAPSKAIQIIDPRPLPSKKPHSHLSEVSPAITITSAHLYSAISSDHDYCKPVDCSFTHIPQHSRASTLRDVSKGAHDSGTAAECKARTSAGEASATLISEVSRSPVAHLPEEARVSSETPADKSRSLSDRTASEQAAEHKTSLCTLPTPPPSPPVRGRDRRRYRRGSRSGSSSISCSSSSSSSSSRSPKRRKRSGSSSGSSSRSRSTSRSPPQRRRCSPSRCSRLRSRRCSRSRSRSKSRSPAPRNCRWHWTEVSRESQRLRREHEIQIQKLRAIDERRVVYVGRICRSMTHSELRERFSQFGDVECVSLHFRERGDHYGFVTFYNMSDAFAAIDNGSKLRRPDELPFDLCFGGRRQFCNSDYTDLDANRDTDASPAKNRFEDLDFDELLKQAQKGMTS